MTNKQLFLIADIHGKTFTINPQNIETISDPDEHQGMVTNKITMASGATYVVPVELIIAVLNTDGYTMYDMITQPVEDADDVNNTEYVDETPLEDPSIDATHLFEYPESDSDEGEDYTEYLTSNDDVPEGDSTTVTVEPIVEGSVVNG